MMAHTGIHENLKTVLWPEFVSTAAKLENIMVNPHKEKYAQKKLYGKMIDYTKHLSNLGEMGVVWIIATVKSKLDYQVMTSIFLGYAQNHTGGTYRKLNLRTKCTVLSRDVIWKNETYGE